MVWLLDAGLADKCYDLDFLVSTFVTRGEVCPPLKGDVWELLVDRDLKAVYDLVRAVREEFGRAGLVNVLLVRKIFLWLRHLRPRDYMKESCMVLEIPIVGH
jgi:hypothetical protein